MVRILRRRGLVVAVAAAAMLGGVGTAAADPGNAPGAFVVPLVCDDGNTYTVIVNGNGEFGAAHDAASNSTFIPTMFGPFHGVLTAEDGTVLDEFTDPASSKGSSTKARATSVSCTFSFDDTFTDPDLGVLHFVGEGSVVGFKTPAH